MTAYDSEVGTPTKIGPWEQAVDVPLLVFALTTIRWRLIAGVIAAGA